MPSLYQHVRGGTVCPDTRWSSQSSDPQWIRVDLGAPATLNQVKLVW